MTLSYGTDTIEAVLFDLDDVLVPFHTPAAWQWAWKPQGPLLGDRRVRSAVKRSLKAWDRRRWQGVTRKSPPTDLAELHRHLADTLATIAGHPLPESESGAVVRRFLRPAGEVERFADARPAIDRLAGAGVRSGVVTPLPAEAARWLLRRTGLPETLLLVAGDPPGPVVPERAAFRAGCERLGSEPARTAYVGDLFWSDVRAAHRAGLRAVLLDRRDAWPKVQAGRFTTLDALEGTLAAGAAPLDADRGADE